MDISFRLTSDVIRTFPDAQIRFVVATGLRNDEPWEESEDRLRRLEEAVADRQWQPYDEDSPAIASWHDAYRLFGTNPRRSRPSVDALSRRLRKSGTLPRINSAVDTYNYISVKYGTPAGAFDASGLHGPVRIRFAQAGDTFTPLGSPTSIEELNSREVVYAHEDTVLTRHWNYRDCDQTKVTVTSENVVFIIERISAEAMPTRSIASAQEELAELVQRHAEDVTLAVVEAETPVTDLRPNEPGLAI